MTPRNRRRVAWSAAGALALMAGAGFVLRTHASPPLPRVAVEGATYSFAGADSDADVECTFGIRNVGRAPLVLNHVRADCTCTRAKLDRDTLAAGESTTLRATYHTPARMGRAGANIGIDTNDPGQPKVFVRVEGTVRPILQLVPATLYLERRDRPPAAAERGPTAPPGQLRDVAGSVAVWAWGDRPVRVESVKTSAGWLDATFIPNSESAVPGENLGRIIVLARGVPADGDGKAEIEVTARAGDRELHRTIKVVVDVN